MTGRVVNSVVPKIFWKGHRIVDSLVGRFLLGKLLFSYLSNRGLNFYIAVITWAILGLQERCTAWHLLYPYSFADMTSSNYGGTQVASMRTHANRGNNQSTASAKPTRARVVTGQDFLCCCCLNCFGLIFCFVDAETMLPRSSDVAGHFEHWTSFHLFVP